MKKAIGIILVTILVLALLGGAVTCSIFFTNDKLIYNALFNKDEDLAKHCQSAYTKLTSNSYFDFTFSNPDNKFKRSDLKIYIDEKDNVISNLTIYEKNVQTEYVYELDEFGSAIYYTEDDLKLKNVSVAFDQIMHAALDLSNDYLPGLDFISKDLARPFTNQSFELDRYFDHKVSNVAIFDLTKSLIGVKYGFELKDDNGNSLYDIYITIDKDYTIREMYIMLNTIRIDVKFNHINNSISLQKKTPSEKSQYIEISAFKFS